MNRDTLKQYTYYIVIGVLSLFSLAFLPMLGSSVGIGFNYPQEAVGKVVWWATKIIVSIINVMVFYSFMEQAKINIRDDEKYKEGMLILSKVKQEEYHPRSPKKWNAQQYSTKGTSIFVSSTLATMALTQALLTFDYVSFFTYLFTLTMGIIFGVLQMKKAEVYWTSEFYDYAKEAYENGNKTKQ